MAAVPATAHLRTGNTATAAAAAAAAAAAGNMAKSIISIIFI